VFIQEGGGFFNSVIIEQVIVFWGNHDINIAVFSY
jgi:hypothetical protein